MKFKRVYFLGIGGIGMSALARYFMHEGKSVAGYDRTETPLTQRLTDEGAVIHYDENIEAIPVAFRDPDGTLVVYTPAVPDDHVEFGFFREGGFQILKRSQMLGAIAEGKYVMAIAGSHGKTTTTTLTAWLNHESSVPGMCGSAPGETALPKGDAALRESGFGFAKHVSQTRSRTAADDGNIPSPPPLHETSICPSVSGKEPGGGTGSAFLGGISGNFDSNLVLGSGRRLVVEADEFDRSFLRLYPDAAVITAVDADHLDIYGTHEAVREAFAQFVRQIRPGGTLILKHGVELTIDNSAIDVFRYAYDTPCDFYARNISLSDNGFYRFDVVCPDRVIADCTLGIPGWVNVENAVAAIALMWAAGFDEPRLRDALTRFRGVKRRFEIYLNTPRQVYMDDYAHHPEELRAAITSVRGMFSGRRLTAVFQPHLYTRTRDFHREFADCLSLADEVVLVPIYPAREEPISGVDSELIGRDITVPWRVTDKECIADELREMDTDVVVTFGAGDIERYCAEIAATLVRKA